MTPAMKLLIKLNAMHQNTSKEDEELTALWKDRMRKTTTKRVKFDWPKFEMPTGGMRKGEVIIVKCGEDVGKSLPLPELDFAVIEQRAMDFIRLCERKNLSKMGGIHGEKVKDVGNLRNHVRSMCRIVMVECVG